MDIRTSITIVIRGLAIMVALQFVSEAKVMAGTEDLKEYSGSTCVPYKGNGQILYDFGIKNFFGSPNTVWINCSLLRDLVKSDMGFAWAKVYVDESRERQPRWCRLRVIKQDHTSASGYTELFSAFDSQTDTDNVGTWFYFNPKKDFSSRATYSILCELPPGTGVRSISMMERDH